MQHNENAATQGQPEAGLSRMTTLIFAVAAGLSVANVYYAQPLLDSMARDFAISPASIGLVVTLTQIGYGLGLISIVPLGDLVDRRRLIVGQGLLSVIALIAVATARTEAILFASMAAQSRLVGGYMAFYSIGSALGAIAATVIYARAGWTGVSILGAVFSAAAFVVWAAAHRAIPATVRRPRSCS